MLTHWIVNMKWDAFFFFIFRDVCKIFFPSREQIIASIETYIFIRGSN